MVAWGREKRAPVNYVNMTKAGTNSTRGNQTYLLLRKEVTNMILITEICTMTVPEGGEGGNRCERLHTRVGHPIASCQTANRESRAQGTVHTS